MSKSESFVFYDAPECTFSSTGTIKHPVGTYAVHYQYYHWGKKNFCRHEYHWVDFSIFPNVEEFITQQEEILSQNILIDHKITFYETQFYC